MRRFQVGIAAALTCVIASLSNSLVVAQTSLSGSSMALNSAGTTTLTTAGYLGTYLTVPAGGATINFTANATEGASGSGTAPHMNIVVADSTFGFNITSTSATNYTTSNVTLPAGTYFVRDERDYANTNASTHAFTLNNLSINTVAGSTVTFSNASTDANAFAASDTYIANFRQGPATVKLLGATPGTQVKVDLSRINFNFGDTMPGTNSSSVNAYLGNNNTAQQINYQKVINQNFNSISEGNMGKWASDEPGNTQPASPSLAGLDTIFNYAQAHGMTAREHNLIWGNQQPTWVNNLITAAGTSGNTTALSNAITNRINYLIGTNGNRSLKYSEIDIYNESYHTGQNAAAPNYWSLLGASGIANIFNQSAQAVTAVDANTKLFLNEYNVLQNNGTNYATFYVNNIDAVRNAGGSVSGIGIQYYPDAANGIGANGNQHSPARIESTLQSLDVQGLPLSLNEFGESNTNNTATSTTTKTILSDAMRLMFGNAQSTGFYIWGSVSENGGGNLFVPAGALYNVSTSNWNGIAINDNGKVWQDLLGIQDWDSNPNNGWTTHTTATVNPDGTIDFSGYYGQYALTINGKTYNLNFTKGTTQYTLAVPEPASVVLAIICIALLGCAHLCRENGF